MKIFRIDFSALFGLIGAFLFVGIAVYFYGSGSVFINLPALLIVLGGTFCAVFTAFPLSAGVFAFSKALKILAGAHHISARDKLLKDIIKASQIVHNNGLLYLQSNYLKDENIDAFWRQGLGLLVDGVKGDECQKIMSSRMQSVYDEQMQAVSFWAKTAEIAPAMGLIGTLIGLVQMLAVLSNPVGIGPAMAVALLTTFYGAILSYVICLPIASRLEQSAQSVLENEQLCLSGFKAIDIAQNPRKTQLELNALLPAHQQIHYFEG